MPRPPAAWSERELADDVQQARSRFVSARLASLEFERRTYHETHQSAAQIVHRLLQASDDLRLLTGASLRDREVLGLARQLAIPPISVDDLDTLTDSCFGQWLGQKTDRGIRPSYEAFERAARLIRDRLDTDRIPWIVEKRSATVEERRIFVDWTAAGPAAARVLANRRNEASARQEAAARSAADVAGYQAVSPPGDLRDPIGEMPPGSFVTASRKLNGTNMDIPIRLRTDHPTGLRFLAIECKASNSSLNSRKRLLEVARKREVWDNAGTLYQFRTAAVLSGVFSLDRLLEAQRSGVWIFWEHRLEDLTDFLLG